MSGVAQGWREVLSALDGALEKPRSEKSGVFYVALDVADVEARALHNRRRACARSVACRSRSPGGRRGAGWRGRRPRRRRGTRSTTCRASPHLHQDQVRSQLAVRQLARVAVACRAPPARHAHECSPRATSRCWKRLAACAANPAIVRLLGRPRATVSCWKRAQALRARW